MKNLTFSYNEAEIHFSVNPTDKNVMVNATEMAKIFERKTEVFLRTDHAKAFIEALKKSIEFPPNGGNSNSDRPPNSGRSDVKIIDNRGHVGIFFDRRLALKFAAWLNPEFEVWVYSTIDQIVFGNYKKHWEAHAKQETAKEIMRNLRTKLLTNPTVDAAQQYFEAEAEYKAAKNAKSNAIRTQLRLFGES